MQSAKHILTPEERRQRNHDEVVANILQAARDVMREQGVAALNLQEVARRVGMRAPSLYNYFASKNAIYEALFVMGMRMFRERQEAIFAQHGSTWESVERTLESYLAFALENPELYQLLFERPVPGFVPSPEGLEESAKLLEIGDRAARQAASSAIISPDIPPEVFSNLLIAVMHGFTAQHLANEPHLPAGSGRFGSLIPFIMEMMKRAWSANTPAHP